MISAGHSANPPRTAAASATASLSGRAACDEAGDTSPGRNRRAERSGGLPSANCPNARTNAFGREAQAFGATRRRPRRRTAAVAWRQPRSDRPILRIADLMPQSAPLSQRRCPPRPARQRPKAATALHRARRPMAGVPPHVRPLAIPGREPVSPESVWLRAALDHKLSRPAKCRPSVNPAHPRTRPH